jgi:hypothetical protein
VIYDPEDPYFNQMRVASNATQLSLLLGDSSVERIIQYVRKATKMRNQCRDAFNELRNYNCQFHHVLNYYDAFFFMKQPLDLDEVSFKLITGMNYWKVPLESNLYSLIF